MSASAISEPEGIAVDAACNIYVDDSGNKIIREIMLK